MNTLKRRNLASKKGAGRVKSNSNIPPEFLPDLLELARDYLQHVGWFESVSQGRAVDGTGPVPWITYPAIEMLKRIDVSAKIVFEYGAGGSSIWWARRAAHVTSIEYNPEWQQFVRAPLLPNNTIRVIEKDAPIPEGIKDEMERHFFQAGLDPEPDYQHGWSPSVACRPFLAYATSILQYPAGHFDVIVVDGAARVLCAWLASQRIGGNGLIVFDNTDRIIYQKAYEWLASQGFARIDFWGPSPINRYESCTSIFSKSLASFLPAARVSVAPRPEHWWR
jgi:hypothetical protein